MRGQVMALRNITFAAIQILYPHLLHLHDYLNDNVAIYNNFIRQVQALYRVYKPIYLTS